jgi:phenylacetate-CoA ligase
VLPEARRERDAPATIAGCGPAVKIVANPGTTCKVGAGMPESRNSTWPPPHAAIDGAGWPAVPGGRAALLLALLRQLESTQYLHPAELRARQFKQLGLLVAHAARTVPFYKNRLPNTPLTADTWSRLPLLTRRQVREAGAALHARELPRGHGKAFPMATSGSTGAPVAVMKSELEQLYWQAFTLREESWHGRDIGAKYMAIRHDHERTVLDERAHVRHLADWGPPVALVYPTGPAVLLDVRCTVAAQVEVLQREAPAYLQSFGSNLGALARHCRAHGILLPSLRGLRSSGEVLGAEVRALCRMVWGLEIADMYSAVETGYLAFQCPGHEHYHVQAESALVEVLDDDGRPCGAGETGRMVVTPLHNFAMPLLRYDLGDLAEVGPPCPCGRTLPVLTRIHGRARAMLTLPSGAKRFAHYGKNVLIGIPDVLQHQAVQHTREDIELFLVVRRPLTADEEGKIRAAVLEGLGYPFRLTITYCDAIARNPSGKYDEFRSEIAEDTL